jgi:hypothetical protein
MPITADRAEIIHFAGRHRLSPALRDGAPALVAVGDPGQRVGWADFFAALRARGLAASFDPEDAGSVRLVPAGASGPAAAAPAHGPGALAEARRFLAALRGRLPPA